ncbi:hypothetical protein FOXG_06574 [Fusarium oxysporum f. sp. lycopersici 4287]|uniref:Uncharacterized protein n=1 Tax=Fusarium oxysporum f. sp. lycopersici (strain 4287 / CBS 123668 / FGSC 9935 / NRRL 34936) TaxID=426428 RepID=A0A0J9V0U0_FUSO4|nr:hypothetical protein FOXG_06574 [Fusarium oxysporum f. sp. lycopersici 4287]XP_018242536.1 hypothetical protein FOXG_06574 [Fusarium oxysporum f. sp. lycopersici 4287]KNB04490.1 hypothetical protein FOXG_06574 [Fusarium oxysporum f. sp. lycopersici 4287]KNB04491.1 hypothetical protein FOXG_06574 [Fusarium oxysporum f. sp. lycopersici 4287]
MSNSSVHITFGSALKTQNSAVDRLMHICSVSFGCRWTFLTAYSSAPAPLSFFLHETNAILNFVRPATSQHLPHLSTSVAAPALLLGPTACAPTVAVCSKVALSP